MATLIGDVFTETSRFHNLMGGPGIQHQHSHESRYQDRSRSRTRNSDRDIHIHQQPHQARPGSSPQRQNSATSAYSSRSRREWDAPPSDATDAHMNPDAARSASILPSPPSSSSPPSDTSSSNSVQPQHGIPGSAATSTPTATRESAATPVSASISSASSTSTAATVVGAPARTMPSPDSDSGSRWAPGGDGASDSIPVSLSANERPPSPVQTQTTIRVRDLAHIQSLARADLLTAAGPGILNDPPLQQMKYEISGMPIGDIIEMVAALLTKITTTNDLQHDALNRNATHVRQAQAQARQDDGAGEGNMSPLSSSVLAFHGKNVPAITILSYLSRIHKYCPTTYEVFLSLLVYFDRMTERVNEMVMRSEEARRLQAHQAQQARQGGAVRSDGDTVMRDNDSDETDSDLADTDDDDTAGPAEERRGRDNGTSATAGQNDQPTTAPVSQATYFVVDSFNIHRLIIAGVTCASKFFSDVFYTNSRYAKVGGLPLPELNHLELQFLLLNDFRLAVPVEDLEAYATMLVEFYAREVVAQRSRPVAD
ncbi:Cyclin domain containing protein [Rhypophila decipiens]